MKTVLQGANKRNPQPQRRCELGSVPENSPFLPPGHPALEKAARAPDQHTLTLMSTEASLPRAPDYCVSIPVPGQLSQMKPFCIAPEVKLSATSFLQWTSSLSIHQPACSERGLEKLRVICEASFPPRAWGHLVYCKNSQTLLRYHFLGFFSPDHIIILIIIR